MNVANYNPDYLADPPPSSSSRVITISALWKAREGGAAAVRPPEGSFHNSTQVLIIRWPPLAETRNCQSTARGRSRACHNCAPRLFTCAAGEAKRRRFSVLASVTRLAIHSPCVMALRRRVVFFKRFAFPSLSIPATGAECRTAAFSRSFFSCFIFCPRPSTGIGIPPYGWPSPVLKWKDRCASDVLRPILKKRNRPKSIRIYFWRETGQNEKIIVGGPEVIEP